MSQARDTRHDAGHLERLERLWTDEGGARTERVRGALDACAQCAAAWERLERTEHEVARLLVEQREDERGIDATRKSPGEDRIASTLARAMSPPQTNRGAPRRTWLAAAALVIALGAAALYLVRDGRTRRDTPLGAEITHLAPSGHVAAFESFSFDAPDDGGWYEIELVDPATANVIARSGRFVRSPWTPSATERANWPSRFEWRVSAYDASGTLEGQASALVEP